MSGILTVVVDAFGRLQVVKNFNVVANVNKQECPTCRHSYVPCSNNTVVCRDCGHFNNWESHDEQQIGNQFG
jgi:Fe2+ or Zn2+ uptake regulation protein